MISDDDLYRLAMFLGSVAMLLIVLYHFLEVNAKDTDDTTVVKTLRSADGTEEEAVIKVTTSGERIAVAGSGSTATTSGGKKGR
jgi:oligosaccharyl transferase complex subunit OST4